MSLIDLIIKGLFVLLIILGITMLINPTGLIPLTLKYNCLENTDHSILLAPSAFHYNQNISLFQYAYTLASSHIYKIIKRHPRLLQFSCSKAW
jgi:hypothetical protein